MTNVSVDVKRIVVIEYPKSGGSWLVSMLGNILSLPQRDIYVGDGFNKFDLKKHPWYEGAPSFGLTESCVIKSHELPDSPLHNFPAKFVHLVRDGRDVIISKYFYEKDFCVKNKIYDTFDVPFDEYVERVSAEWSNFVLAWLGKDVIVCRYEDFLEDAHSSLRRVLSELGKEVDEKKIAEGIEANTKEKMKEKLGKAFEHNTFVRKCVSGDWKNHFIAYHKEIVKKNAGGALIACRYVKDLNW